MTEPRWLADEMVGRLARYLRFLGHDTEYAQGVDDEVIVAWAQREERQLLTRDRALARRLPGSVLLRSTELSAQLREVRAAAPDAEFAVTFRRCTLCNGALEPWVPVTGAPLPEDLPRERVAAGLRVYACARCGHRYWEGSHTERVRRETARWLAEER